MGRTIEDIDALIKEYRNIRKAIKTGVTDDASFECINGVHKNVFLSKRQYINGTTHYHLQCKTCGKSISGAISKKSLTKEQIDAAKDWENNIEGNHQRLIKLGATATILKNDKIQAAGGYDSYLQSQCWEEIRCVCLEKANHTCECCGNIATHCHHLSYENIYDESQDDLMALCSKCHDTYHVIDDRRKRLDIMMCPIIGGSDDI